MPFVLDFNSEACSDYVITFDEKSHSTFPSLSLSVISGSDSIKTIPSTGSIHRHPAPILETV